jgi:hypothetical protein
MDVWLEVRRNSCPPEERLGSPRSKSGVPLLLNLALLELLLFHMIFAAFVFVFLMQIPSVYWSEFRAGITLQGMYKMFTSPVSDWQPGCCEKKELLSRVATASLPAAVHHHTTSCHSAAAITTTPSAESAPQFSGKGWRSELLPASA